jgi:hypothetical protein
VSLFFNFGTTGAAAGEKTYYWDDIKLLTLVGVETVDAAVAGIKIYPNPASDFCTIEFPEFLNKPASLSVIDASGRVVNTLTLTQQNQVLNLQQYSKGMYFLKIEKDAVHYYQKLLIVR